MPRQLNHRVGTSVSNAGVVEVQNVREWVDIEQVCFGGGELSVGEEATWKGVFFFVFVFFPIVFFVFFGFFFVFVFFDE